MTSLYESLLPKMATVLELTQQSDAALSPQAKQALVHSVRLATPIPRTVCTSDSADHAHQTNDFKESLRQAREAAQTLRGGELSLAEQDEVIAMLERLKARKTCVRSSSSCMCECSRVYMYVG